MTTDKINKAVAERIKKLVKSTGLTVEEFCKKNKISKYNMNKWISGEHGVNNKNLIELAEILNCTTDYLLGLDNKPSRDASIVFDELALSEGAMKQLKKNRMEKLFDEELFKLLLHRGSFDTDRINSLQNPTSLYIDYFIQNLWEKDLIILHAEQDYLIEQLRGNLSKKKAKEWFEKEAINYLDMYEIEIITDESDYYDPGFSDLYREAKKKDGQQSELNDKEFDCIGKLLKIQVKKKILDFNAIKMFEKRISEYVVYHREYFEKYFAIKEEIEKTIEESKETYNNIAKEGRSIVFDTPIEDVELMPKLLEIILEGNDEHERLILLRKRPDVYNSDTERHISAIIKDYLGKNKNELRICLENWKEILSVRNGTHQEYLSKRFEERMKQFEDSKKKIEK